MSFGPLTGELAISVAVDAWIHGEMSTEEMRDVKRRVDQESQNRRNEFIRSILPMYESEWPGSTLLHHVITATLEQPKIRSGLEEALLGQRMSIIFGSNERLKLHIISAKIGTDAIELAFDDEPEEVHVLEGDCKSPDGGAYSFIVPQPQSTVQSKE